MKLLLLGILRIVGDDQLFKAPESANPRLYNQVSIGPRAQAVGSPRLLITVGPRRGNSLNSVGCGAERWLHSGPVTAEETGISTSFTLSRIAKGSRNLYSDLLATVEDRRRIYPDLLGKIA